MTHKTPFFSSGPWSAYKSNTITLKWNKSCCLKSYLYSLRSLTPNWDRSLNLHMLLFFFLRCFPALTHLTQITGSLSGLIHSKIFIYKLVHVWAYLIFKSNSSWASFVVYKINLFSKKIYNESLKLEIYNGCQPASVIDVMLMRLIRAL